MLTSAGEEVNQVPTWRLSGCECWKAGDTIGAKSEEMELMATAKENELRVITERSAEARTLTRREIVQRLLAGAGAGAAWPLVAASHPIYEQLKNGAILNEVERLEKTANWRPVFLNAQQNETLIALAESIVPGSMKANVSRFIDLLLSVDKAENQTKFVQSLAAFQAEAQKRFGKRFPALTQEQKNTLLSEAATNPGNSEAAHAQVVKTVSPPHAHFENLKGWVSGAYYSSEVGMRELGWTGDYAFAEFHGCAHTGENH